MLSADDDCNDCIPKYLQPRQSSMQSSTGVIISSLPFALTFLVVATILLHNGFPLIARSQNSKSPFTELTWGRGRSTRDHIKATLTFKNLVAITFAVTCGLGVVLAELIWFEIIDYVDPDARKAALRVTVDSLLALLIVVIPLLEIHSILFPRGYEAISGRKRLKMRGTLEAAAFLSWLGCFWYLGRALPGIHKHAESTYNNTIEACLERVGIIGISTMALLSGFASVSSLWQAFGVRPRQVSEADIARKQAGLEATVSMLSAKRARFVQITRKLSEGHPETIWQKAIGTIRGNADVQERDSLAMEISGLETMSMSLQSSLTVIQDRYQSQLRASTKIGRIFTGWTYTFSIYCAYRIIATSITSFRRWWYPSASFSGTDPITHILALIAKHFDPDLDRLAWSRQISFLFSGLILAGSFSAVLQTFHWLTRYTPYILRTATNNMALLIAQICGMYVISSTITLRSVMPKEVGSVINEALGTGYIEAAWVDRWFEGWFLGATVVTAMGIWIGRKVGSIGCEFGADEEGWDGDVEMGKRS
ncbi:MAG: hypothetical protein M1834_006635 [Cirrosporium novae-zelandiae]|nr:MAG: hypothetical protein M1834_006635 [Cirrosporium novae-zelandiae]